MEHVGVVLPYTRCWHPDGNSNKLVVPVRKGVDMGKEGAVGG